MAFQLAVPDLPDSPGGKATKAKKPKSPEWDAAYRPGIRPLPLISISKNVKPPSSSGLMSRLRAHYGRMRM
jgi:hypothetical protein